MIGRSRIVGMPQSILLAQRGVDATVTIAHSRTIDMADLCRSADLIVGRCGKSEHDYSRLDKTGCYRY